jgi:hypothetical protein
MIMMVWDNVVTFSESHLVEGRIRRKDNTLYHDEPKTLMDRAVRTLISN